jgi:shikimate dehydrogenase
MPDVDTERDPTWSEPERLVLLGHPVAHSLSPRFQQAALDAAGRAVRYTALDTPPHALTRTLHALRATRAAGNVTVPHKEAVFAACDVRTDLADRVGAVNTFRHDTEGRLIGHNTDVAGVRSAMIALLGGDTPPTHVVLLGSGGAAGAVLVALTEWPETQVTMVARTPARAQQLVERVARHAPSADGAERRDGAGQRVRIVPYDIEAPSTAMRGALACASLVVNATPLGLLAAQMPMPCEWLGAETAVLDLVYQPGETAWVRACRDRGLRAEDGLRMLVEQGVAAYAWWFGHMPDRAAMWRALEPRTVRPVAV